MIGKKITALALLSALADQALAAPSHVQHRQLHNAVEKRALETTVVTVLETVTVTLGQEPQPTTTTTKADQVDQGGIFNEPPVSTSTSTTTATTYIVSQQPQPQQGGDQGNQQGNPDQNKNNAPVTTTAEVKNDNVQAKPTTTAQPSSSSSTSQEAPKSSTPVSSGGSGKRGIAYNDGALSNKLKSACSSCSWVYNWETQPKGGDSSCYIPSFKDSSSMWTGWFQEQAPASFDSSKAGVVFSLNEPDNPGQSNVPDTGRAAALHAQYLSPFYSKAKVGSPSVTNSQAQGQGLSWLSSFVESCKNTKDCSFNFCNVHWYDHITATDSLFAHLEKAHEICGGKPIWLTEFAVLDGSVEDVAAWLKKVLPKLDSLSYLEGYAYFMAGNAQSNPQWNLFDASGSLNAIGQAYAS